MGEQLTGDILLIGPKFTVVKEYNMQLTTPDVVLQHLFILPLFLLKRRFFQRRETQQQSYAIYTHRWIISRRGMIRVESRC